MVEGASASIAKDPGSLGSARDDKGRSGWHKTLGMTQDARDDSRQMIEKKLDSFAA